MPEILTDPWIWLIAVMTVFVILLIVGKWLDGKDDGWMP